MNYHIQLGLGIIIIHAWAQAAFSQHLSPIAKTVQELGHLLIVDVPPKGDVFPQVTGPNLQDHVCIVGAGPAGIHMALSLKDRGYRNVTIFEKTDRVGGKIKDVKFDGYYQWQGAIFLTSDYFDNIIELAKRYKVGKIYPIHTPGVSKKHLNCLVSR
jgi:NADPH-dependent 2,4-dienoyl-CoA reductase/sulfur reductase-like enzyme